MTDAGRTSNEALEFDYVIVGAGSAGAVLANRLSADPNVRVALLEAGGEDSNPWIHIPAGYYRTIFNPSVTWSFEAGPEPHLGGRMIPWPRGRVLGGTSAINGLLYVRGQAQDFDTWAQLGNRGWSHSDVLPYFKRAEDQERGGDDLHGKGGPLGVSDVAMANRLCEAYIAAGVAAGLPRNDDFNGSSQEGVGYYQLTTRHGRRCSTAVGYLAPVKHRQNLTILTHTFVDRIVLDGRRAVALDVNLDGEASRIAAKREIVLSAGAIGSPQILQVSGIGPPDVLKRAGVAVTHALPGVGRNLQDHFQVRFVYDCTLPDSLNMVWHSRIAQLGAGLDYLFRRRGMLTIGAGVVGVFARSREGLEAPDVQIHFMPLSAERPGGALHRFPGVTASVCQLRPESRGFLDITAPDAAVKPRIVANYLDSFSDRQVTLDGLKLMRRIAAAEPFAGLVRREFLPGPEVASDDALMSYARERGTTIYHPCGTAKMGSDPMAVVDARLRVHGLEGLRVVDASIIPTMTSGNTNAPTIMIGEKAADMMIEDRRTDHAAHAA